MRHSLSLGARLETRVEEEELAPQAVAGKVARLQVHRSF